jgi:hypothetical protein
MRIARALSAWKYGKCQKYRKAQYLNHFHGLIRENGSLCGPVNRLQDGWALDLSGTLPHLKQMLADANEIIKQRGGVKREHGGRAFFQQLLAEDHLLQYPSILDFATSSEVLTTICSYLGFIPVLSGAKPLGVRLNESDARFDESTDGAFHESQLFHCDYHDSPMAYVIVVLRDVALENGPFCFLPAAASRKAREALGYGIRGRPYRLTDEELYAVAPEKDLHRLCYPAGTVLFLDNNACFHYGSRNAVKPRYLMMYAYLSACRTDFADVLEKEWRYSTRESDSRLRKMVLNRQFMG